MKENQFIIKPFDFSFLFNTYKQEKAPNSDYLRMLGIKHYPYSWEVGKPQMINKVKFGNYKNSLQNEYFLTTYFNLIEEPTKYNSRHFCLSLDKTLCCSSKAMIGRMTFVEVKNEAAFTSVKDWIIKYL